MKIKTMIPFLDDDELKELADKIAKSETGEYEGVTMRDLLPFLEEEDIDALLIADAKRGVDPFICYPFASEEGLNLLVSLIQNGDVRSVDIKKLLPFLEDDAIDKLAEAVLKNGDSAWNISFHDLLPFLSDEVIDRIFIEKVKKEDPSAKEMAPFVNDETFHKIVDLYLNGEIKNIDIDSFYYYMDEDDLRRLFKKAMNKKPGE